MTKGRGRKATTSSGSNGLDPPPATSDAASPSAPAPLQDQGKKKVHRFQPGQSGNPGGRPKGTVNLWNRIQMELLKATPDERKHLADIAAQAYVQKMMDGDSKVLHDYLDREEGKAIQRLQAVDSDGDPVTLLWPWEMGLRGETVRTSQPTSGTGSGSEIEISLSHPGLRPKVGENGSKHTASE